MSLAPSCPSLCSQDETTLPYLYLPPHMFPVTLRAVRRRTNQVSFVRYAKPVSQGGEVREGRCRPQTNVQVQAVHDNNIPYTRHLSHTRAIRHQVPDIVSRTFYFAEVSPFFVHRHCHRRQQSDGTVCARTVNRTNENPPVVPSISHRFPI